MANGAPVPTNEMRNGFKRIGLGKLFHATRLEECGEIGLEVLGWLSKDGVEAVKRGAGVCIHSTPEKSIEAHKLFMVLARALYLFGVRTRIIGLFALLRELEQDELSETLVNAQAIFITNFYSVEAKGDTLTPTQVAHVKEYLLERMADGDAIFTLTDCPIMAAKLWPSKFLRRLETSNRSLEVR